MMKHSIISMLLLAMFAISNTMAQNTNTLSINDAFKQTPDSVRYAKGLAGKNRITAAVDKYFCFAKTEQGFWGVQWITPEKRVWAYQPETADETIYLANEWIFYRSGIISQMLIVKGDTCFAYTLTPASHKFVPSSEYAPKGDVELQLKRTFPKSELNADQLKTSIKQPE